MEMNKQLLNEMIQANYVKVQKHPTEAFYIYNYTPQAQYERVWNECTLMCRGLILDDAYQIIARPFEKFFNLGECEEQEIPKEPFEVFEKMDGSLGISYWVNDKIQIATRGSFDSSQAHKANELLYGKYKESIPKLIENYTYLFEIIYPKNRIVLDYGQEESLVLLAVIDKETGEDIEIPSIGFPIVKKYDGLNDLHALSTEEASNKEGFVVKFKSGYRLKVKFEEYVRIHRIISNVSSVSIWENLKTGEPFDEVLAGVPDEFYAWVKATRKSLLDEFQLVLAKSKEDFKVFDNRKETALYFLQCRYPAVLFNMLDNKPLDQVIWKMLKPVHQKPFSGDKTNSADGIAGNL